MKGYKMNEDLDYVNLIIKGIIKKEGHCPCVVKKDDTTLCPCDTFISTGICKCKLFLKIEEN